MMAAPEENPGDDGVREEAHGPAQAHQPRQELDGPRHKGEEKGEAQVVGCHRGVVGVVGWRQLPAGKSTRDRDQEAGLLTGGSGRARTRQQTLPALH